MLLLAFLMAAAAAPISERDGNIFCGDTQVTNLGTDSQPALAPDGHTVAFVRSIGQAASNIDAAPSELWLGDCNGMPARRLLASKTDKAPERNLASVNNPTFSLDGGFVYLMAQAWTTSDAVHQVRIADGREKFVIDGNSLSVLRTGPYRGYLLVQRHKYHDGGGAYDPTVVVRPDGHAMLQVPGTEDDDSDEAVSRWLTDKGWQAW